MNYIHNNKNLKSLRRSLRTNSTDAEIKLWQSLRRKQIGGYRFLRQYSIDPYIIDFYCPKKRLALELDGGQHFENKERDKNRITFLEK